MPSLLQEARELRQKRAKVIADARELATVDDFNDEARASYEAAMAEAEDIKARFERYERQHALDTEIDDELEQRDIERGDLDPDDGDAEERKRSDIFERYIRGGERAITGDEYRALQSDSDEAGGFLVAPMEFVNKLIQAVDDRLWIRGLATKLQVTGSKGIGAPSLDADPADADWTTELATGDEDSTMDFGAREMVPHPVAKLLKVSRKLVRQAPSVVNLVRERLAYKFAVTQEKAFLTGSGASQPLGLFTASALGISTSRDVSTGNTTSSPTTDGLTRCKFSLKDQYLRNARWLFHRDAILLVALLKDGNGQYLWRENVRVGEPDILLGRPVMSSEFAPNTFTTGLYAGMLADFEHYWIADALDFELQRLDELYAATHQVGFIGRMEADGAPVLEEAFARVKLG